MSLLMKVSQPPPSEIEMLKVTQMMTMTLKRGIAKLQSSTYKQILNKFLVFWDLEVSIGLCLTVFVANCRPYLF